MNLLDQWFLEVQVNKHLRQSSERHNERMRVARRDPEHPDHEAYYGFLRTEREEVQT